MGKWMASLAGANVAMEVELRVVAPTAEVPTAMVGVAMAPRTVAAPTAMVEVAKAPTVAVLRVMVEVARWHERQRRRWGRGWWLRWQFWQVGWRRRRWRRHWNPRRRWREGRRRRVEERIDLELSDRQISRPWIGGGHQPQRDKRGAAQHARCRAATVGHERACAHWHVHWVTTSAQRITSHPPHKDLKRRQPGLVVVRVVAIVHGDVADGRAGGYLHRQPRAHLVGACGEGIEAAINRVRGWQVRSSNALVGNRAQMGTEWRHLNKVAQRRGWRQRR